jgi:hypothetical protein
MFAGPCGFMQVNIRRRKMKRKKMDFLCKILFKGGILIICLYGKNAFDISML